MARTPARVEPTIGLALTTVLGQSTEGLAVLAA
ncbi:Uncharacterised protein [Mycobacteroides abscessus]|nr:Uncharacterised protein [Mycobacteroides abscessus]